MIVAVSHESLRAIMSSPAAQGTALVTSHCGLFRQTDVLSAHVVFPASN